ncbi:ATP-cone [Syntrophomonas zehnderi OL-4]|uniref:Transcriptional repressor NrdR n=1 Tax=Syntrophomonas zehnderi OL-4 TaxID=690567 RepID=A0A0E4C8M0_9FIRM|nr:transcriptional regulator NrdR [Syntrophomonas zehnderi]CFX57037.1 ATP-cone [Syntrophomonas zehnderi OL-4]
MRCPYCREADSRVIDSRACEDGLSIRRRRECIVCKRRFTSYERVEERPLLVIKKGGTREPFDRNKLLNGISRACEKRPVSIEAIENIVAQIELDLRDVNEREISSMVIGEMVMDRLRDLDEVAYVRFASVYRQFTDLNSFINTIDQMKQK